MKSCLKLSSAALLAAMVCFLLGCTESHKIAVVAHMGFHRSETGRQTPNSIASLKAAQENLFWGSECDVNLTSDDVIVVCHGPKWQEVDIRNSSYADTVRFLTLHDGETVPTLDQYLDQLSLSRTVLVLELKVHHICKKIAKEYPEFTNQYLGGDILPSDLHKDGINGIDYSYPVLHKNPEWIKEAHDLGMSVNVWTIDKEEQITEMIGLGVDQITTNEPLLTRSLIPEGEELPVPKK